MWLEQGLWLLNTPVSFYLLQYAIISASFYCKYGSKITSKVTRGCHRFLFSTVKMSNTWVTYGVICAPIKSAMQTSVTARGYLSVCPSFTFRYCVQTNEDTIVRFSASRRTILLVSGKIKLIRIFAGDHHPQRGRKIETLPCRYRNFDQ